MLCSSDAEFLAKLYGIRLAFEVNSVLHHHHRHQQQNGSKTPCWLSSSNNEIKNK